MRGWSALGSAVSEASADTGKIKLLRRVGIVAQQLVKSISPVLAVKVEWMLRETALTPGCGEMQEMRLLSRSFAT